MNSSVSILEFCYWELIDSLKSLVHHLGSSDLLILSVATFVIFMAVCSACWMCLRILIRLLRRSRRQLPDELAMIHFYAGIASGNTSAVDSDDYTERCVELLRKYPNLVNVTGSPPHHRSMYTPFLRACWNNNYELLKFMVQIGADVLSTNSEGESAIYLVVYRISKQQEKNFDDRALNLLVDAGCSVNHPNSRGNTAMHLAARAGHAALTRWLLFNGADPEVANHSGYIPLTIAVKYHQSKSGTLGHFEVAQLLKVHSSPSSSRTTASLHGSDN